MPTTTTAPLRKASGKRSSRKPVASKRAPRKSIVKQASRTKPVSGKPVPRKRAGKPARGSVRGTSPSSALIERATQNTLAANPLIGIRRKEVLAAASTLQAQLVRQPVMVSRQYGRFLSELARVAVGRSELAPAAGDRRFTDAAWTEGAGFR